MLILSAIYTETICSFELGAEGLTFKGEGKSLPGVSARLNMLLI